MTTPKTETFKFRLTAKQMRALEAYAEQREATKTEVLINFITSLPTYNAEFKPKDPV